MKLGGIGLSSEGLDSRRRRILFRCWHRGIREMDLLLGKFADSKLTSMSDQALDGFEKLLEENDLDLLAWIIGRETVPDQLAGIEVIREIQTFHSINLNSEK